MNPVIWAIPGFMGLPSDWSFLNWSHLKGVDLYAFSWNSLTDWAKDFNQWVLREKGEQPKFLMGYSLGGRLALHALLDSPQQWKGAIIVSAHIGLDDPQQREIRDQQDRKWAERFEREEWSSLMQAWNGQEIFAQDEFYFNRQEQHYQRSQLAKILVHGSIAKHMDLSPQIATLPVPILWITGKDDQPYCRIAKRLSFAHPYSRWEEVTQAGHRIPWSKQQVFSKLVQAFLQHVVELVHNF
jgi:2-succinyl-6-hydroxy-2,4-cyclohexadiene-1-carboxylate synthase